MVDKEVFISWNCNGINKHLEDLKLLTFTYNPAVISLQETHLKSDQQFYLPKYNILSYTSPVLHASGGATLAIKSNIGYTQIHFETDLQAVTATIYLSTPITICSIYLPPNNPVTHEQINTLISSLPRPFIINGDFNAHSSIWGSSILNTYLCEKIYDV